MFARQRGEIVRTGASNAIFQVSTTTCKEAEGCLFAMAINRRCCQWGKDNVLDMLFKRSRVAREHDIAKTTLGPSRAKRSNIRILHSWLIVRGILLICAQATEYICANIDAQLGISAADWRVKLLNDSHVDDGQFALGLLIYLPILRW